MKNVFYANFGRLYMYKFLFFPEFTRKETMKFSKLLLHLLALFPFWAATQVFGQSEPSSALIQARKDVEILTSDAFSGRGYQRDGHTLAATWIEQRMDSLGLRPLDQPTKSDHPHFQPFFFPVHLPEDINLQAAGCDWKIGRDYIVSTESGSGKLDMAKLRMVGHGMPENFKKSVKGCVVVIEEGLPAEIASDPEKKEKYKQWAGDGAKIQLAVNAGASAVIILKQKLTASFCHEAGKLPVFLMLKESWCTKAKKVSLSVNMKAIVIESQNVIGWIKGSQYPDSTIILSAHYDHLGMQGEAIFPGANDNASGIATLLALAAHYAKREHRPKYNIAFIAFGGEEVGLIGSRYYVNESPWWPLRQTKFVLNLDLMGNGDEGITAVAATDFPKEYDLLVALNDSLKATPLVKRRSNAPNSDHYFFVEKGVHGFFIYTMGGPPHYHDVNDIAENLVFSRFDELQNLIKAFLNQLQEN